jgi:hypothetical protein
MATDPKTQDRVRTGLLILIYAIGVVCVLPFVCAMFRLLRACNGHANGIGFYELALRGGLALVFAGIVLCVLILFYRLRNDEASPSLTSGVAVIAIGALTVVLLAFAARGQKAGLEPSSPVPHYAP